MKVLITGSNGLLGQKLVKTFSSDHQTTGIDLQIESFIPEINFTYQALSILDVEKLKELFSSFKPEVVINTAAYTDVDGCEENKELAWSVNVDGVKNLVDLCKKIKAKLIHLSTDYIFDGKNGPYSEEDIPNPVGYYGLTKLESEKSILSECGPAGKEKIDFLIVRTNVLYGKGENLRPNFVLWLIQKLSSREKVRIVTDQYNNPTLADNLASAIKEAIEKNISGILNIAGSEYLSRYDFTLKIAKKFKLDQNLISPAKTSELKQKAPRPRWGGLKIDKAKKLLKTELLNIEKGLESMK
ncbi:MAG: dTDP-4-dehydrorhamnose reductase [candidate division Zixibacteria bacterium]|nr:dTDP-4-dehydrorhamnose reductase [candidate division Zixibacteria bacterium]